MEMLKAEIIAKLVKEYTEIKYDIESNNKMIGVYKENIEGYEAKNKKIKERLQKLEQIIAETKG